MGSWDRAAGVAIVAAIASAAMGLAGCISDAPGDPDDDSAAPSGSYFLDMKDYREGEGLDPETGWTRWRMKASAAGPGPYSLSLRIHADAMRHADNSFLYIDVLGDDDAVCDLVDGRPVPDVSLRAGPVVNWADGHLVEAHASSGGTNHNEERVPLGTFQPNTVNMDLTPIGNLSLYLTVATQNYGDLALNVTSGEFGGDEFGKADLDVDLLSGPGVWAGEDIGSFEGAYIGAGLPGRRVAYLDAEKGVHLPHGGHAFFGVTGQAGEVRVDHPGGGFHKELTPLDTVARFDEHVRPGNLSFAAEGVVSVAPGGEMGSHPAEGWVVGAPPPPREELAEC